MGEVSEKVSQLSETEVVTAFRDALVAAHPALRRLDIVSDAGDVYDDFDRFAESLWDILVLRTLMWKYGLDTPPQLPRYGFFKVLAGVDGYIEAVPASGAVFRFVDFLCDAADHSAPFTVVRGESARGDAIEAKWDSSLKFTWRRTSASAGS
jgi:hypothetical protein